jgi:hypothetical protein
VDDLIGSTKGVDNRNNFALGCGHIEKEEYDDMYIDPEVGLPRDKPHYVSYAYDRSMTADCTNSVVQESWRACFPLWRPELDEANRNRTVSFDAAGKYNLCQLPPAVMPLTSCIMGCFAPDQRLLFTSGYEAIATAVKQGMLDIVTLAPDATFDVMRLMNNKVASYIGDSFAQEQEMITLRMDSGATLRVTPSHPLLAEDGTIRQAKAFIAGERLIKVDGTFEAIAAISSEKELTRVYNVQPATRDNTSNVIIAEGYLSASHRYQSEDDKFANRRMLRAHVPSEIVAE